MLTLYRIRRPGGAALRGDIGSEKPVDFCNLGLAASSTH
jgi:hypothetical protein